MSEAIEDWNLWLKEGMFLSYRLGYIKKYFQVENREFSHYEWDWPESIAALATSGPYTITDLEVTEVSDKSIKGENAVPGQIWQLIFGFKTQVLIYVQLPTDIERHGVAKRPKATPAWRFIGHYDKWMSPWYMPSMVTEHFLIREFSPFIALSAYNPQTIALTPRLNFFLAKLAVLKIGEYNPEIPAPRGPLIPTQEAYRDTLEKLYNMTKPCRPISVLAVRAPPTAT